MQSSFGAHKAEPGRLVLREDVPHWIEAELERRGYRVERRERTSGPINAIYFDREHGTMWGGASKALSLSTADAFADAMVNAPSVDKIVYDGAGHFIHIGRPDDTARDVKAFFDAGVDPYAIMLAETRRRCRRLGLAVELLPAGHDVDVAGDLPQLARRLSAAGDAVAPPADPGGYASPLGGREDLQVGRHKGADTAC